MLSYLQATSSSLQYAIDEIMVKTSACLPSLQEELLAARMIFYLYSQHLARCLATKQVLSER